ncbi:MAG: hypothetical protein ACKOBX_02270 [Bacteroidota bacterium]
MIKFRKSLLFSVALFLHVFSLAQEDSLFKNWKHKKNIFTLGMYKQPGNDSMVDVWDGFERILGLKKKQEEAILTKPQISFIPSVEYSIITGLAASINSNIVFPKKVNNASFIYFDLKRTVKKQTIVELVSNMWFAKDRLNLNTDWSIMRFPQKDFGLGSQSTRNLFDQLNYSYLKLHQTVSVKIAPDWYAGIGIRMDYFWRVSDTTSTNKPVVGFREYGFSTSSLSNGISLNLLHDTRRNAVHPLAGERYFQTIWRNSSTLFGSSSQWSSLIVDARKYLAFPQSSNNILAFWSYNVITLDGKPPYLVLPHTAVDPFKNTGRGYIQGRYRGRSILMQEMEYRFSITENGFLGGVLYGNVQSISNAVSNRFSSMIPGYGVGIRIKYNKKSNTNIALDYAWGKDGSRGFFMNLGEVF